MKFSTTMVQTGNNTGIEVPQDLEQAFDGSPAATAAWQKLSNSQRKAHVTAVRGAKAADTRSRRIASVIAKLVG